MKNLFLHLQKTKNFYFLSLILITFSSCSTYQNTANSDGIYDSNTKVKKQETEEVTVVDSSKSKKYEKYFKKNADKYEVKEDEVFTNIDTYKSEEENETEVEELERDADDFIYENNAWEDSGETVVNVYNYGGFQSPFFNRGFYRPFYNPWAFNIGWYGNGFYNPWAFNSWGFNFWGYGYCPPGFYSGFGYNRPFYGNNYYGHNDYAYGRRSTRNSTNLTSRYTSRRDARNTTTRSANTSRRSNTAARTRSINTNSRSARTSRSNTSRSRSARTTTRNPSTQRSNTNTRSRTIRRPSSRSVSPRSSSSRSISPRSSSSRSRSSSSSRSSSPRRSSRRN